MSKAIEIKVFDRQNKRVLRRFRSRAPRGLTYTPEGLENALKEFADEIDRVLPGNKYNAICTGPGHYNFVWNEDEPAPEPTPEIKSIEITQESTPA